MSENNDKTDFPKIPAKVWWQLRDKFKKSIPPIVTPSYISTALGGMTEVSAKKNILSPLKRLEIIDAEGKPTEYAKLWRDNEEYSKFCEEIRNKIYPEELLHAQPPPTPDRNAVQRWFSSKTGVGEAAAKMLTATYSLLCEAQPLDEAQIKQNSNKQPPKPRVSKKENSRTISSDSAEILPPKPPQSNNKESNSTITPSIHIDVQIHISPESTAEQIDQIFTSMSKHLGKMSVGKNE